jgi:hypothetical protein
MQALKRLPRKERSAKAREWGAKGLAAQAAARIERGPDAETVRKRALDDRRGLCIRRGTTYRADGSTVAWWISHSIVGRSDQFDIVVDNRLWRTGGMRKVKQWLNL